MGRVCCMELVGGAWLDRAAAPPPLMPMTWGCGYRCAASGRRQPPSMAVDWNMEVLDQVESHWTQRLRPRLDGLSDEEYFWQPVPGCWTISRRGESRAPISYGSGDFTWDYGPAAQDPEPMTTIAWRLGHLTECLASMNGTHFEGHYKRRVVRLSGHIREGPPAAG